MTALGLTTVLSLDHLQPFAPAGAMRFTGERSVVTSRLVESARRSDLVDGNLAVEGHRLALLCAGLCEGTARC